MLFEIPYRLGQAFGIDVLQHLLCGYTFLGCNWRPPHSVGYASRAAGGGGSKHPADLTIKAAKQSPTAASNLACNACGGVLLLPAACTGTLAVEADGDLGVTQVASAGDHVRV
jgi:hypothetical protein